MREAVAAVVREAAVTPRPPAEQAVQRRRAESEQQFADLRVDRQPRRLFVDRLLEASRRLARGRGERDQRLPRPGGCGLLGDQGDDPGDRRRLAGAGSAGDHGEAAVDGHGRGIALAPIGVGGEQPLKAVRQPVLRDLAGAARERMEIGGDLALLAPVTIEVQPASEQPQRPFGRPAILAHGNQLARRHLAKPLLGLRPRQRREVDGFLGFDARGIPDRAQVDEHVAEPRGPHRQRHSERHGVVLLPGQRLQPRGDVNVGRGQQPDLVERPQQSAGGAREPRVERIGDRAHAAPWSSTSLSARTSSPGGCHTNTPHRDPSTVGVSAPAIPRRNR